MEAPKEIFVTEDLIESNALDEELDYIDGRSVPYIKYILADLAELTWEDIRQLFKIADNYESELNRPKYLSEGYCKEVLRRFLERKRG